MDPDTKQKLGDLTRRAEKQRRRFYARRPKALQSVLSDVIAKRGYAAERGTAELAEAWNQAAGEVFARCTRVAGLRRGRLEVRVSNSAMLQEINFHRLRLLREMQQAAPDAKISSLFFKVGRID